VRKTKIQLALFGAEGEVAQRKGEKSLGLLGALTDELADFPETPSPSTARATPLPGEEITRKDCI